MLRHFSAKEALQ